MPIGRHDGSVLCSTSGLSGNLTTTWGPGGSTVALNSVVVQINLALFWPEVLLNRHAESEYDHITHFSLRIVRSKFLMQLSPFPLNPYESQILQQIFEHDHPDKPVAIKHK